MAIKCSTHSVRRDFNCLLIQLAGAFSLAELNTLLQASTDQIYLISTHELPLQVLEGLQPYFRKRSPELLVNYRDRYTLCSARAWKLLNLPPQIDSFDQLNQEFLTQAEQLKKFVFVTILEEKNSKVIEKPLEVSAEEKDRAYAEFLASAEEAVKYIANGEFREGLERIDQLLLQPHSFPSLLYAKAVAHLSLNEISPAKEALNSLLQKDVNHEAARRMLADLSTIS